MRDPNKLEVYVRSVDLAAEVLILCEALPVRFRKQLIDQVVRAALSIPGNIGEGNGKDTHREYLQYLRTATGSANELAAYLDVLRKAFPAVVKIPALREELTTCKKMLAGLAKTVRSRIETEPD
ncbi:MAG: uncharacterized protein JWO05_3895 [Gemmatimonadetes bacterium]|nr:uncharacterized protein [Gemmatimonadota bacterium]